MTNGVLSSARHRYLFFPKKPQLTILRADMKELSPPNVNMKRLYEQETQASEPVLIIISPGADPSQELEELAKQVIGAEKYHQVRLLQSFLVSFVRKERHF